MTTSKTVALPKNITKAYLARTLGIDKLDILETPLSDTMKMFSCTVSMERYLKKLVPHARVNSNEEVRNEGQRNHIDRSKTSQIEHITVAAPPPQHAAIDVIIQNGEVVNLDGFHRTLFWHDHPEKIPFKNIRLTVYVETEAHGLLEMYEVYDSPKAVRRMDHKLSSAYRIAGVLPKLQSVKLRTGKHWSALRRLLKVSARTSLKNLAACIEESEDLILFLDNLLNVSKDTLQNVELLAFGKAFNASRGMPSKKGTPEELKVRKLGLQVAASMEGLTSPSYRPLPAVAALYDSSALGLPYKRGGQSGEKVLDANSEELKDLIMAQVKTRRTRAPATSKLLKAA